VTRIDSRDSFNPFTGRWIARIGPSIICQAGSPEQVSRAAKSIRGKERFIISFIPLTEIMAFPPLFYRIQEILNSETGVYLVGGAVRNALLNQPANDLDFAIVSNVEKIARKVSHELNTDFYPLDTEREAYRLIFSNNGEDIQYLDFSRIRGNTIDSDLLGRDFTINAMAVNINDPQKLIDPLGGAQDLRDKIIKACSSSSITDDPIRVLRAIRFAAEGNYKIAEETRNLLKIGVPLLEFSSAERKRDELFKIAALYQIPIAFRALDWLGVFSALFPGTKPTINDNSIQRGDIFQTKMDFSSSGEIVQLINSITRKIGNTDNGSLLYGMAGSILDQYRLELKAYLIQKFTPDRNINQLLHIGNLLFLFQITSTAPKELGLRNIKGMNLSREETHFITILTSFYSTMEKIINGDEPLTRRDAYLFFKANGSAGVAATLLCLGNYLASHKLDLGPKKWKLILEKIEFLWEAWWNKKSEIVEPIPLLNGDEIAAEFQLAPGEIIGNCLDFLKEEQAAGSIKSRKDATEKICEMIRKMG
jgi:tRNA nucleotidyltransferase/poly(A) polymerase